VSQTNQDSPLSEPELNAETTALVRFLLQQSDTERARLSRTLHDELGGLLVAAKMDLGYLESTLGSERLDVRRRLAQIRDCLDSAVSVERRVVEELQPGLLVHIGLFAALQWRTDQERVHSKRQVRLEVPESEVTLPLLTRTALYRAMQEALTLSPGDLELIADYSGELLQLQIGPLPPEAQDDRALRLRAILHRVSCVGGSAELVNVPGKGSRLVVRLACTAAAT